MGEAARNIEPRYLSYDFSKIKEKKNGEVIIEGYANRSLFDGKRFVDRGKEHIPSHEWRVDEFMENPIIFFNHDRNFPIGKAIDVKVKDDGLWIKVLISNSKDPEITRIRDLIKEGILKTFSVGIDVDSEEQLDDGTIDLKGVDLIETSVVSIPMNQKSEFSVTKDYIAKNPYDKIAGDLLKVKGAWVASAVHMRIFNLIKDSDKFNREEALQEIAKIAEVPMETLFQVLAGNVTDVPDEVLSAIGQVLSMDVNELQKLNAGDVQVEDQANEEVPEEEEVEEAEEVEEEEELAEDDELEEEEKQADQGDLDVSEVEEEASEDDQLVLDDQAEANARESKKENEDEKQNTQTDSFRECVSSHVREALDAGKDREQAIAFALSKCREGKSLRKLSADDWLAVFDAVDGHTKSSNKIDELDVNLGNKTIQALQQNNAMLGQLITIMQDISKKLDGMFEKPQEEELELDPDPDDEPLEEEERIVQEVMNRLEENSEKLADEDLEINRSLDIMNNYKQKLNQTLASLNF